MNQKRQYTNLAFISYKREDEHWAKWLQNRLEHYKLPTEIVKVNPGMEFKDRPRHVFKDTTDLSGGVLAKAIKEGLDSSKFLVVICSPRAAKSPWVCKEVQEFIDTGREEFIVPFIIDGVPNSTDADKECFPAALKSLCGERELLGININENGRDSAAVKVVARLFELRFDTLWDRFQKEAKRRRRIVIAALIALVVGVAAVASWIGWQYVELDKRNAQIEKQNEHIKKQYDQIQLQNSALDAKSDSILSANDSITRQKLELQAAYNDLAVSEANLQERNQQLKAEKDRVLAATQKILRNQSIEYGNLAYKYIEEGKLPEAEALLSEIIPNDSAPYVYTPEMERALRRFLNYKELPGVKLVENKEILDDKKSAFYPLISKYGYRGRKTSSRAKHYDFDNLYFLSSDDESLSVSNEGDTMIIFDNQNQVALYEGLLEDGIYSAQFLNDNRIGVAGRSFFSIFKYDENSLKLERRVQIKDRIATNFFAFNSSSPCFYLEEDSLLIYQRYDSCLVIKNFNTDRIWQLIETNGFIDNLTFKRGKDAWHSYIAFSYYDENGAGSRQRLNIRRLNGKWELYDSPIDGYVDWLGFTDDLYLCSNVATDKNGIRVCYVWDINNLPVYEEYLFNASKSLMVNKEQAETLYGKVLCITEDACILSLKKNERSGLFDLKLFNPSTYETDSLLSVEREIGGFEFDISDDGRYIVLSNDEMGVWLFDKTTKARRQFITGENKISILATISSDGNTVAYYYYDYFDGPELVIYNLMSDKSVTYNVNGFSFQSINMNSDGSRLMLMDNNYLLMDFNLITGGTKIFSTPEGFTSSFGYSKHGNYLYQLAKDEGITHKIKVWKSDTYDLIMENYAEGGDDMTIFDEKRGYIYSHNAYNSNIIQFLPLDSLFEMFRRQ